jgi:hypothetical protein
LKSHGLASFWKRYRRLPEHIQKLADKNFTLFKTIRATHRWDFRKRAAFTQSKSAGATVQSLASETAIIIGSGLAPMKTTTISNCDSVAATRFTA